MAEIIEDPDKLIVLFSGAVATGAGDTIGLRKPAKEFTVQITDTDLIESDVIDLEGSLDSVTWFQLARHTFTASEASDDAAMFHIVNKPVNFIRGNIITYNGTALTAKAIALPTSLNR
jgi:hypothetical protein